MRPSAGAAMLVCAACLAIGCSDSEGETGQRVFERQRRARVDDERVIERELGDHVVVLVGDDARLHRSLR